MEAAALRCQHDGHGHEGTLSALRRTLMSLHKLGRIMEIVIRYLVDVDLWPIPDMGAANFFGEAALMGRNFATALRPMLRRWKKDTKHDRALVQQVSQNDYCCGFHELWILAFALTRSKGLYKCESHGSAHRNY